MQMNGINELITIAKYWRGVGRPAAGRAGAQQPRPQPGDLGAAGDGRRPQVRGARRTCPTSPTRATPSRSACRGSASSEPEQRRPGVGRGARRRPARGARGGHRPRRAAAAAAHHLRAGEALRRALLKGDANSGGIIRQSIKGMVDSSCRTRAARSRAGRQRSSGRGNFSGLPSEATVLPVTSAAACSTRVDGPCARRQAASVHFHTHERPLAGASSAARARAESPCPPPCG